MYVRELKVINLTKTSFPKTLFDRYENIYVNRYKVNSAKSKMKIWER